MSSGPPAASRASLWGSGPKRNPAAWTGRPRTASARPARAAAGPRERASVRSSGPPVDELAGGSDRQARGIRASCAPGRRSPPPTPARPAARVTGAPRRRSSESGESEARERGTSVRSPPAGERAAGVGSHRVRRTRAAPRPGCGASTRAGLDGYSRKLGISAILAKPPAATAGSRVSEFFKTPGRRPGILCLTCRPTLTSLR